MQTLASLAFLKSKKQRSANAEVDDVGHRVLGWLREKELSSTPSNYSLIYDYIARPDGLLARAIDSILIAGDMIDQSMLDHIAQGMAAASTDNGAQEEQNSVLRHQARQLAEVTQGAADANEHFGRGLASDLDGIENSPDQLISQVQQMIARTEQTEQQLAHALNKIDLLREEVEAERGNAGCDALTGLLNRRGIQPTLDAVSARDVVAIIDLDHFKSMNDSHGHMVGDRILKLVATSLKTSFSDHALARWGGEEFIVAMKNTSLKDATRMVDDARADLSKRRVRLRETDELIGSITFSAGLALIGKDNCDQALKRADEALYLAKQNGRNRVGAARANRHG